MNVSQKNYYILKLYLTLIKHIQIFILWPYFNYSIKNTKSENILIIDWLAKK